MQLALYSDILSDIVPVLFPLQAYYTDFGTIKRYRSYHIHHEISSERISYTCAGRGRAWKSARARKVPCLWSIGGYHSCARARARRSTSPSRARARAPDPPSVRHFRPLTYAAAMGAGKYFVGFTRADGNLAGKPRPNIPGVSPPPLTYPPTAGHFFLL